ncbi:MAG TPA: hypothetical protein VLM38_17325 [Blastocatellia bacterium]|nr:hypothetical protein [Blastocatellia bacterium]
MRIVKRAGLSLDWSLTVEEGKNDRTRKRAYLPRIEAAYAVLPNDEKLVACWIVANEVASRYYVGDQLNSALAHIGWNSSQIG